MSSPNPLPKAPTVQGELDVDVAAAMAEEKASRGSRPTPEELLEGLNEPQRAAVAHEGAPLLVVAGAGSGKTRVLTRRIAWLIAERHAHPGSILAITFTNKAAAEMRARVEELVGRRARIMWVSTFHSACVRILRKNIDRFGYKSSFSIYDAADSTRLMTQVCKELDLDSKKFPPRAVLNWVSNQKNELIDHEDAAKDTSNDRDVTYAEAYSLYQQRLRAANALDFDDLIMMTVHLFQAFPDIRETYRRRFRHVLVDEYQDTNHAQYALVRELCAHDVGRPSVDGMADPDAPDDDGGMEPSELMVVGDADQSIYAFRGASIRNILAFEEDFPDAQTILLEQNYRSTQTILSAANAVISRNRDRKAKNLWSDAGDGDKLVGYVADDEHDEARFVADEVQTLTKEGEYRPGDVAVFYRTNAQSRVFEEVFIRSGLPYRVVGGVRFYERREIKDALAYLRILVNPDDQISLRRILNVPKRGIGDRAEGCVEALARRDSVSFWDALRRAEDAPGIASRSLNSIRAFVDLVEEAQSMVDAGERADVVLEHVLAASGYLKELEDSDDPQDETRVENLAELVAVAREFADEPIAGPSADPADPAPALPRSSRLPRARGAGRRQRPDPRPCRRERRRRHADDAAHREGPGVPVGVPDRPRGRRLPAPALARGSARARGGEAAGVRRAHPRAATALHLACSRPLGMGRPVAQPALAVHRRAAARSRRVASYPGGPDVVVPPGSRRPRTVTRRSPVASAPPPPAPTPTAAASVVRSHRSQPAIACSTTRSAWATSSRSRAPATMQSPPSTSAPRASSACCSATRPSRSSVTRPQGFDPMGDEAW